MDGSPKSHLISKWAVDNPLNGPDSAVNPIEVLPLIEIADDLAEIIRLVAKLGEFPVDDEHIYPL
jgi:hypothetical protein